MSPRNGPRAIHSVSFGAGDPTFVGVAGSFADWSAWEPTFDRLRARWRCVGFDHDGVGATEVDVGDITHARHVDTLFSVLDAHGIERCVVGGHSVNASVAIDGVLRDPGRFDGLVIANGHGWAMDRPEVRDFTDALRSSFSAAVDFFVEIALPEPDSDAAKNWLRSTMHRTGPEACARILEAKYEVDLRDRLCEVSVPTLVVHGALDRLSPDPFAEAATFAREIPDARLVVLDDAGHLPLRSRPEVFASLLGDFMSEVSGRTVQDRDVLSV